MTAPRLDLAELRRLHEAATPDWEIDPTGDIGTHFIGTADEAIAYFEPIGETVEVDDEFENPQSVANAACAVASRNALPALLAAVRAAVECRSAENDWCQAGDREGVDYMAAFNRVGEARKALDAALAPFRKEKSDD